MTAPSHGDNTGPERPSETVTQEQPPAQHVAKRTRVSALWVAITLFAVVLLLLLVFILENSQSVDISYFGVHGHLPLGVALLLAAVLGILLTVIAGFARIVQLRTAARRQHKIDTKRGAAHSR